MRATALLLALLLLAVTAAAAPPAGTPWRDDPRFRRPVALEVEDQPLWELLGHLRAQYDLPVRADDSTRDERITIFCKARPAGDLLATLAKHLDYGWIRQTPKGKDTPEFVLTQPLASKNREREARGKLLEADLGELRHVLDLNVENARRTPEEQLRDALAYARKERARATSAEEQEILDAAITGLEQGHWVNMQPNDRGLAIGAMLLSLRPEDRDRLWQGERLRFSYPPRADRLPLTKVQAEAIVRPQVEARRGGTAQNGTTLFGELTELHQLRAELALQREGYRPKLRLRGLYVADSPGVKQESSFDIDELGGALPSEQERKSLVDETDPELQKVVEIRPDKTKPKTPELEWMEVLRALHAATSFQIISDSYDGFGWQSTLPTGKFRLCDWLKKFCRVIDVQVTREGGTLLFRHRDWPRLRALQTPERFLRPWEAALKKNPVPSLAMLMDIASHVSDEGLLIVQGRWERKGLLKKGYEELLRQNLEDSEDALRLLHRLGPQVRADAAHAALPLQLPDQRAHAMQLLKIGFRRYQQEEGPMARPYFRRSDKPVGFATALSDAIDEGRLPVGMKLEVEPATTYLEPDGGFPIIIPDSAANGKLPVTDKAVKVPGSWYSFELFIGDDAAPSGAFGFFTSDASPQPGQRENRP